MDTNSENSKLEEFEKTKENILLKNKITELKSKITELESQNTSYKIISVLLLIGTFGPVILKHC